MLLHQSKQGRWDRRPKKPIVEQLRQKDTFDLFQFMPPLFLWYDYGLIMVWLGRSKWVKVTLYRVVWRVTSVNASYFTKEPLKKRGTTNFEDFKIVYFFNYCSSFKGLDASSLPNAAVNLVSEWKALLYVLHYGYYFTLLCASGSLYFRDLNSRVTLI